MIYGKFVEELTRSLQHHIVAYDSMPRYQGCVLYMRQGLTRVELEPDVIVHERAELLNVLCGLIDDTSIHGKRVRISLKDGRLAQATL